MLTLYYPLALVPPTATGTCGTALSVPAPAALQIPAPCAHGACVLAGAWQSQRLALGKGRSSVPYMSESRSKAAVPALCVEGGRGGWIYWAGERAKSKLLRKSQAACAECVLSLSNYLALRVQILTSTEGGQQQQYFFWKGLKRSRALPHSLVTFKSSPGRQQLL